MSDFKPPSPEELDQLFDNYTVTSFIAQGGMGAVYMAHQNSLDRTVAIKILPPELGEDKAYLASFESEAKSLAKLNHSNLVGIYDFGVAHDMYYIIMEYVAGRSLYYTANGYAVDELEAAFLISEICKGLAHAHEHGILHRDIKPANILIDDEARPMLVDFGLAKPVNDQNLHGVIFGTPGYTAPEVVNNPDYVDHKADIFSVGVMLYELLTAELPAEPGQPFIFASQKNDTDIRFDAIITRAMHPNPYMRYNNCTEMARDLDLLVTEWDLIAENRQGSGTKILATAANAGAATGELMRQTFNPQMTDPNLQVYNIMSAQAMTHQPMMQQPVGYEPQPFIQQPSGVTMAPVITPVVTASPLSIGRTVTYTPKVKVKSSKTGGAILTILICLIIAAAATFLLIQAKAKQELANDPAYKAEKEREEFEARKKAEEAKLKAVEAERKRIRELNSNNTSAAK